MRNRLFVCLFLAASPLTTFAPRVAHAQVSDADRAAARDLFFEGVKLQNEGKFTDALDRFSRAQRIFSAPTHLLHVAECQIATGQLVEGAETYRTLVRTPLPAGSPAAFTQARDQGAAELAQVEPRIPTVKIDVTPQNVANLQVQIDGVAMNTALVGVSRPIDPGAHKIAVFAPGYARQEVPLNIKERETKALPITLSAQGGVVYAPAPVTPPPPTTGEPPPAYTAQPTPPAPTPTTDPAAWETEKKSQLSLLGGVRLGVMFPTGSVAKIPSSSPTSTGTTDLAMSDIATVGGAIGLEGGLRFARRFFVGVGFEHGVYGKGDKVGAVTGSNGVVGTNSTSISSNLVDARIAFISNPDGVGFYGEIGAGYRWLIASIDYTGTAFDSAYSDVVKGVELEAGAGIFVKAGRFLRFIPKASFGIGAFNKEDVTSPRQTTSADIANTAVHTFVFLGVGGYYNYDLDAKK